MRREGFVKGKTRRAIAIASAVMLACSSGGVGMETGLMTAYGQESEGSLDQGSDEAGESRENGAEEEDSSDDFSGSEGSETDDSGDEERGEQGSDLEGSEESEEEGADEEDSNSSDSSEDEDTDETGTESGNETDEGEDEEQGSDLEGSEESEEEDADEEDSDSSEDEDIDEAESGDEADEGEDEEQGSDLEGSEGSEEEGADEEDSNSSDSSEDEDTDETESGDEADEGEDEEQGSDLEGSEESEEESADEEDSESSDSSEDEDTDETEIESGDEADEGENEDQGADLGEAEKSEEALENQQPVQTELPETAAVNQLPVMMTTLGAGDSWYSTDVYTDGDGYYYTDAEKSEKITNTFIQVNDNEEDESETSIIYLDENGEKVKSNWIENEDGFRYVNGKGHVVTDTTRMAGGSYGQFAEDGLWTAIENTFFTDQLEDGREITFYSGEEGKVAGPGEKMSFYTIVEEDGRKACYVFNGKDEVLGTEKQASLWVGDLYVASDGYLVTNTSQTEIDGVYYDFDESGHGSMITNTVIEEDGKNYYIGESGTCVTDQFVEVDGETLYFGADGSQQYRQWIEDEGGFRYVNGDGHVIKDKVRMTGGYYGSFDSNGYWTAIEDEFFTDQLEDGREITFYSGEEGKVAGPGEKMSFYTIVVEEDGRKTCYVFDGENEALGTEKQASLWVGDLYVAADGYLVTNASQTEIDGFYYNFDENGHGSMITNTVIEEDGKTYYIGEDGTYVTNQFVEVGGETLYFGADGSQQYRQWIEDEGGFRYVNGDGHVIKDKVRMAGGYYGSFDSNGYWTAIEDEFFTDQLEDGREITFYSGEEGKVAGPGEKMSFYTIVEEGGKKACYVFDGENEVLGTEKQASLWLADLYVGGDGYLLTNASQVEIGGVYYNFDEEGHSSTVTNTVIEKDGKTYYIGESGTYVTNQFVEVGGETLYFGADGSQQYRQWIEDEGGFRYVNGDGHVIKNKVRMAGGYYGSFDSNGYWTAIEDEFFTDQLEDGREITFYSGEEGKVAGPGEKMSFYTIVEEGGKKACYVFDGENEVLGTEKQASLWLADLYVGGDGYLLTNASQVEIGGVYYNFDEEGHSSTVTNTVIEKDGKTYYIGENGTYVTNQFVEIGEETLYFGADGSQQYRQWIEDEGGFRYVNGEGHMIKNKVRMAGGYYGSFDSNGYWTAIENEFFENELDSGETVFYYSGEEGRVYKNSNGRYYGFVEGASGALTCYLIDSSGQNRTEELVADQWIEHLRVNSQGIVNINTTDMVDGIYYNFDAKGYGTVITYKITYVLESGNNNSANPSEYTGENAQITLAAPSRTGYTFGGWYTDSDYSNAVTQLTSKDNSDTLTLYARWIRNSSGDSDRNVVSSSSDSASAESSSAATSNNASNASQVSSAAVGENVTVSVGQTSVSSVVTQDSAGSVTGNTIVNAADVPSVTITEGQSAQVATIAVDADGSARSLLASDVQGTVVRQVTKEIQGVTVTQNVVEYADGTQIAQKSGTGELSGFAQDIVAAEQAIQAGTIDIASAYSGRTGLDLSRYEQVGSAVTYEITPGVNGAVARTQMEQTSLTPGQQVVVMVTDAAGNVTVSDIIVGENGVIQYQIPGLNCIVRLLRTSGQ